MRARTVLRFRPRTCGILCVALLVVTIVRLALWFLPSRMVLRLVTRLSGLDPFVETSSSTFASEVIWAVEAVSRRIPRASCLTQAISAKLMLHWFGQNARLCLGVAYTAGGALRAHAWLERGGRPVLGGSGVQSLVRLPDLPDGVTMHRSLPH
jgi:hypothetical protein